MFNANEYTLSDLQIIARCAAGNVYAGMDHEVRSGIFTHDEELSEAGYTELASESGNVEFKKFFIEEMKNYGFENFSFEKVAPFKYKVTA